MILMMTIDTEEEWDWDGPFPTEGARVENVTRLNGFQQLCATYGLATTYFVSHAVMADARARDALLELHAGGGVELGMHVHPWNTPPVETNRIVTARDSFLHNHPEPLIRRKLDVSLEQFRAAGITPTSFRGGRYSSSDAIRRWLVDHRFVADCSAVPYTRWRDDGAPDYSTRDPFPVRFHGRAEGYPLWDIPLTVAFTRGPFDFWARVFDRVEGSRLAHLRLIGLAHRVGLIRRVWLNFDTPDTAQWLDVIIRLKALGAPCVTITVHSTSLVAGVNPYTRTADDERRLFARIDRLFADLARVPGLKFRTASDAAGVLEERVTGRAGASGTGSLAGAIRAGERA